MQTHRMHIMTGALTTVLLVLATGATLVQAFELQWFGHAAYKITAPGGKVILVDPFITKNPKTPQALKDLNKLDKVDLILVTHGHGDHVGDTAAIAKMRGARVGMNADMGHTFASLGWVPYTQLFRFNKAGPVSPLGPEIKITMVRAEHSSEIRHVVTRIRSTLSSLFRCLSAWGVFGFLVMKGSTRITLPPGVVIL